MITGTMPYTQTSDIEKALEQVNLSNFFRLMLIKYIKS